MFLQAICKSRSTNCRTYTASFAVTADHQICVDGTPSPEFFTTWRSEFHCQRNDCVVNGSHVHLKFAAAVIDYSVGFSECQAIDMWFLIFEVRKPVNQSSFDASRQPYAVPSFRQRLPVIPFVMDPSDYGECRFHHIIEWNMSPKQLSIVLLLRIIWNIS